MQLLLVVSDVLGRQRLMAIQTGMTLKHDLKLTVQNVHGQCRDVASPGHS